MAFRKIEKSLQSIKEVLRVTSKEHRYRVIAVRSSDYGDLMMEFRLTRSPCGTLVIQVHQTKGAALDDFYMTLAQF